MKRRVAAVALLLIAVPALAACGGSSSGAGGGQADFAADGSFAVAVDSDPGDLNPLVTNLVNAQIVGMYSYDTLIFGDPETAKPTPFLATSWTESPTKVTYTLRDGITCADGTSFTAQTAADNLNWIVAPANKSPRLDSVVPADAKASANGNVLTVTTSKPRPFMLYDIGAQQMVCEHGLKNPKSLSAGSDGTGPFVIDHVVAGDSITLTRREGYTWGPKNSTSDTPGLPKTVTIKIVPSPSTRANLLLSGQLNAAMVSGKDEDRLTNLKSQPSPTMSGMIVYNHHQGLPTADADVRRALTQAIDLDTLTRILTGGKGERATSLLSENPSLCTYDTVKGELPSYNADAAAKAVHAVGKPINITLVYDNTTDTGSAAAEYVAKQWEAAGAVVKLDGGDENYVISRTFAAKDPSGWTASLGLNLQSGTPAIFPQYLSGPAAPAGTNFASIDNKDYNTRVAAAAGLAGDAACKAWAGAEQALMRSTDLIPVSVTPYKMYFSHAMALYQPIGGQLPGSAIRVLK
ncbi:ABC transporter substrate-binding protein [Streptomyces sp. DASNCL29]|uniref:ABC transporter substrate-binding protein n=1 Tax=Streptomyces sp. DASNCL29 TaxID=2583819 RepID=UPI00110FE0B5|nr:ABC transporter substrate-binding protein [Streptomyces sp. DASNCL29]TMU98401.1 ABC transporter substrate-binding protein [Streptomyces sp. DASNCL29]